MKNSADSRHLPLDPDLGGPTPQSGHLIPQLPGMCASALSFQAVGPEPQDGRRPLQARKAHAGPALPGAHTQPLHHSFLQYIH
eukprot:366466-Chlamydomonas_euryale.AAC.25